jgi:hypothetical protein
MESKFYYTLAIRDIYGAEEDLFSERSLNIYDMFFRMRKHIMKLIRDVNVDFSMYTLIVVKSCAWKKHNYGKKLKHKKQQIYQYWFPLEYDGIEDFINRHIFRKFCTFEIFKKLRNVSDLIPTLNKFLTG